MGNEYSCSFQKNMRNSKEKKRQRTSQLLADRLKKWANQYITYYICRTKTAIDSFWRSFMAPQKHSLPARTRGHLSPPTRSPHIFIYSLTVPNRPRESDTRNPSTPRKRGEFPPPACRHVVPRVKPVGSHISDDNWVKLSINLKLIYEFLHVFTLCTNL